MDERIDFILKNCAGKKVLHIGCADWPYTERRIQEGRLLHDKLLNISQKVVGVDVSREGLNFLRQRYPEQEFLHSEECRGVVIDCDIIIAGEVIEHVDNPGDFLLALKEISDNNSRLLVTTPNAYSIKGALRALFGKEYCHPDHVVHFSGKTLSQILERNGWKTEVIDYYYSMPTTTTGKVVTGFFRLLRLITSRNIGDGIMLIAIKSGNE